MKKVFSLLFISCFITFLSEAQNAGNIWYFGDYAGIDFNSGSPVSLSNSAMEIFEGCATACDNNGNLLFYENGEKIWDRNHNLMPNGSGLKGDTSSAQSIIIHNPDSCNLYYVFTMGSHITPNGGVWYSVVDMNLNGGYGVVISNQKNIQLLNQSEEGIAAILNSNGHDVWVIVHKMGGKTFNAYPVTNAGVGAPVQSNIGPYRDASNIIGQLKPSHNGNKLVMVNTFSTIYIDMFDFDKATGILSNDVSLTSYFSYTTGAYGIEFSPNDSLLYLSTIFSNNVLYQLDLYTWAALTLEEFGGNYHYGSLQLAPDGKIYMANNGLNYLSVINDPNVSGTGCNFVANGFTLSPGTFCFNGLPNQPNYIYDQLINDPCGEQPTVSLNANDTLICQKFCIDYFDSSTNNPLAWQWIFEGGSPATSTAQNPQMICYNVPGVYDVTLITTNAFGNDTLTKSNYITVYATPPLPVITQTGYVLTCSPANNYQWQLNGVDIPGATDQSYTATETGFYTVLISNETGCVASTTLYVLVTGISEVNADDFINVFPNPSSGVFIVEVLNGKMADVMIEVKNTVGQILMTSLPKIIAAQSSYKIDLSELPAGIYFLEVSEWIPSGRSNDYFVRKKIIVAK